MVYDHLFSIWSFSTCAATPSHRTAYACGSLTLKRPMSESAHGYGRSRNTAFSRSIDRASLRTADLVSSRDGDAGRRSFVVSVFFNRFQIYRKSFFRLFVRFGQRLNDRNRFLRLNHEAIQSNITQCKMNGYRLAINVWWNNSITGRRMFHMRLT